MKRFILYFLTISCNLTLFTSILPIPTNQLEKYKSMGIKVKGISLPKKQYIIPLSVSKDQIEKYKTIGSSSALKSKFFMHINDRYIKNGKNNFKNIKQLVESVQNKAGMNDYKIDVNLLNDNEDTAMTCANFITGKNTINIDEKFLTQFPKNIQKYIIRHELMHLKHRDPLRHVLSTAGLTAGLLAGAYASVVLFRDNLPLFGITNFAMGLGAIAAHSSFRRQREKAADIGAAGPHGKYAQDGINFVDKLSENDPFRVEYLLTWDHPTLKERRAYLQNLQTQQLQKQNSLENID